MADVNLTFTIPDAHVANAKTWYLAVNPAPEDWAGTDTQWIKESIRLLILQQIRNGKRKTEDQGGPPDEIIA
jgi:hypothetical protein